MTPTDGCVSQIHNQTNTRIYDRNIPSQVLQPYLNVRPVMTKYSFLPIVDPRKEIKTRLTQMPTYNTSQIFNPGNNTAPWSGFAANVNLESELRSQVFALQKCSQAVYVPNSNSDLYKSHNVPAYRTNPPQHELLFRKEVFQDFNPNPDPKILGSGIFMNSTRTQVKELGDTSCNNK